MGEFLSGQPDATTKDGLLISGITPNAAKSTGYETVQVSPDLITAEVRAITEANETSIDTLNTSVQILEDGSKKQLFQNITSDFNFSQGVDEFIELMIFRIVAPTSTVKIGTTSGADDIMRSGIIEIVTGTTGYRPTSTIVAPLQSDIYVGVSGGKVDLVVYSKNNAFEIT